MKPNYAFSISKVADNFLKLAQQTSGQAGDFMMDLVKSGKFGLDNDGNFDVKSPMGQSICAVLDKYELKGTNISLVVDTNKKVSVLIENSPENNPAKAEISNLILPPANSVIGASKTPPPQSAVTVTKITIS